jgi:hypothetical protein
MDAPRRGVSPVRHAAAVKKTRAPKVGDALQTLNHSVVVYFTPLSRSRHVPLWMKTMNRKMGKKKKQMDEFSTVDGRLYLEPAGANIFGRFSNK